MKTPILAIRVWLLILAAAVLTACGGGGGSAPPVGSAPVISALLISPSAAYASDTLQSFATQFDFTDPDGNLASLTLRILDGTGATVDLQTLPIEGVDGLTAGTILGQVMPSTVSPDTYTAQIYVTDATGLKSNTLSASVRIAAYPWTTQLADPTPREYAASAVLNGKVYVMGGQLIDNGVPGQVTHLVEIYDPASNTWSAAPPMPTARMGLVAAVIDGRIYAIGGRTDGYSTSAVGTVEVFDLASNLWTTGNPLPSPRYFAAAAVVGGEIHVAGGEFETNVLRTLEAYNPLTNQWRNRTAMPTARGQLAMAEANGRLYAIGGYAGLVSQWVGTVEEYDPLTDTWAARAPMPTARAHLALAQIDGKLLAAGGENVNRSLDLLESYDPVANIWLTKTPSLTAFTRTTAAVANGKMLVFGNTLSLAYDPDNEIR